MKQSQDWNKSHQMTVAFNNVPSSEEEQKHNEIFNEWGLKFSAHHDWKGKWANWTEEEECKCYETVDEAHNDNCDIYCVPKCISSEKGVFWKEDTLRKHF